MFTDLKVRKVLTLIGEDYGGGDRVCVRCAGYSVILTRVPSRLDTRV